jgi:CRISPR-associated protein Cmr1
MPKEIPNCPKRPTAAADAGRRYAVELITPIFGGGIEPRLNDPSFPIRPTAIRGHLQFWWRAIVGAQYATAAELRAAEARIWGSGNRASRVRVLVEDVQTGPPVPCARFVWDQRAAGGKGGWQTAWQAPFNERDSALPYVLFPFQGQPPKGGKGSQPERMPDPCILRASFGLRLQCPQAIREEVEAAVWAWANFGGIGSRTRRGCGTVYCQDLAPATTESLASSLKRFLPTSSPALAWPTLSHIPLVRNEPQDPFTVWHRLIRLYRYFRQGEDFARNPGPGRSRYPEAETVRRIMRRRMFRHEPWVDMPDGFPRAEFGLPIVFQFKDEEQGEPPASTLRPFVGGKTVERMASPLILKPLVLTRDKAVPLILRLNTAGVRQVELQDTDQHCLTPRHAVGVVSSAFTAKGSPLSGLSTAGSALEAFLAFAREEGFTEPAP